MSYNSRNKKQMENKMKEEMINIYKNNKKMHIVSITDDDGSDVVGVFSSKKLAYRCATDYINSLVSQYYNTLSYREVCEKLKKESFCHIINYEKNNSFDVLIESLRINNNYC